MSKENSLRVRFAPSPTGYLHIGGARTCLFNWLYARSQGGTFVVRIEDTDRARSKREFLEEILESIQWLGMDWDNIFYQSERFEFYHRYAQKLIEEKKAYKKEGAIFFPYDFSQIAIHDLIRGKITFTELPKTEEVIIKSDGSPTYNFSCVIDDMLMDITHVIRGEDHISNTPKQALLYQAFRANLPYFAHLPLILSPEGGRMSKRFGATSIREYKEDGYLPEGLVNYLLLLGWSPGNNREIISLGEATSLFKIGDVKKTGAAFSYDKLNWVNAEYIKKKPLSDLTDEVEAYFREKHFFDSMDKEYLKKVVELFRNRITKLSDLLDWGRFCFYDDYRYNEDTQDILKRNLSKEVKALIAAFASVADFKKTVIEKEFRSVAEQCGLKAKDLVHPTRVALTGRRMGPGLFETMEVLGKEKVIKRLNQLVKYWEEADA